MVSRLQTDVFTTVLPVSCQREKGRQMAGALLAEFQSKIAKNGSSSKSCRTFSLRTVLKYVKIPSV
jgi:hypothetical protein